MRTLTAFLCVAFSYNLFAGNTVIKGNSSYFKGKTISFEMVKDYLNATTKEIGFTEITNDGKFQFNFSTDTIRKIMLTIEDKTSWFFVEPGAVYNINVDYDTELNKDKIYDRKLSVRFLFPVPTEINQQLQRFNRNYDQFINDNYTLLVKRDGSFLPKISAFKTKALKEASSSNNSFVNDYIIYSIASMENALDVSYSKNLVSNSFDAKANLYLDYLHEKKIRYNNPEYLNFFKAFFKNEMAKLALEVKGMDITKSINEQSSLTELSKALGKYPFLLDQEFKTLFMINGLRELSKNNYFRKENIVNILRSIASENTNKYLQEMATNMIEAITKKELKKGNQAPSFELNNQFNELVSLQQFKGKYIYLQFWATWNVPSIREMKIMEQLYQKYNDKIDFISICVDDNKGTMQAFLKKNPGYKWTFLHLGNHKKLLSQYQVITKPTYVLIDRDQKIIKAPAPHPGANIERANAPNLEKIFFEL